MERKLFGRADLRISGPYMVVQPRSPKHNLLLPALLEGPLEQARDNVLLNALEGSRAA